MIAKTKSKKRSGSGGSTRARGDDLDRFPKCKSCGKPIDEAPRWTTYGGSGLCEFCEPSREEAPVLAPSRPRSLALPPPSPLSTTTPAGIRANDPDAWAKGETQAAGQTVEKRLPRDWGITVDPEFQHVLRSPFADELAELREDLLARGCLDPLIVWYDEGIETREGHKHFGQRVGPPTRTLIDGHNRFEICSEYRIPVAIVELRFATRAEVPDWIYKHQLGRRNLSAAERDHILAGLYERELAARKNGAAKNGQPLGKAADKVADAAGVSPATVKRAVQGETALKRIARITLRARHELLQLNRRELLELDALSDAAIAEALAAGIECWRLGKEVDEAERRERESGNIATSSRPPATPAAKKLFASALDARAMWAAHVAQYRPSAQYAQSEYLLDAIIAWRGQRKVFGNGKKPTVKIPKSPKASKIAKRKPR